MLGGFVAMALLFALFAVTSASPGTAIATVFLLGMAIVLPTGLQMRLMDVAGDAQTLGAALNHSAFNLANALGAWLGGMVITAGYGYLAPSFVGAGLSLLGLVVLLASARLHRRTATQSATAGSKTVSSAASRS
jgi:DHA1 family inner membrane transport protein